jgi:hypothetical protein
MKSKINKEMNESLIFQSCFRMSGCGCCGWWMGLGVGEVLDERSNRREEGSA